MRPGIAEAVRGDRSSGVVPSRRRPGWFWGLYPLAASPWSPGFGMLTDRFGVTWVVDVAPPSNA